MRITRLEWFAIRWPQIGIQQGFRYDHPSHPRILRSVQMKEDSGIDSRAAVARPEPEIRNCRRPWLAGKTLFGDWRYTEVPAFIHEPEECLSFPRPLVHRQAYVVALSKNYWPLDQHIVW
jgi:hypothetical protein